MQELRQSIESLRDHVQIVWRAIDEVREVIEQVVGHEAAEFWNVEPPEGMPLGRYRPFAGYGPFDESDADHSDTNDADEADTEFVADSTDTVSPIPGTHHQNGCELNTTTTGHQHQRNLWDAPVTEPIEQAPSAEADTTPQKEAEPGAVPFVRTDRQTDFGGLPQYEWPAAEEDRDSICVDRIYADPASGITHRFTIRRGDPQRVSPTEGGKAALHRAAREEQVGRSAAADGHAAWSLGRPAEYEAAKCGVGVSKLPHGAHAR